MKRLLLLFTCALLYSYTLFSQVPPNDLIENATLIETAPFVDSNVRLDLANVGDGGQQVACDLFSNYKIVYYKFTAQTSQVISTSVEDQYGGPTGNAFAIIYSAPDLNATSDSQLTFVSTCAFGNNQANVTAGTSYYILVYRDLVGYVSKVTITINQTVPTSERNALLDIYNNTDGANWTTSDNWTTSNLASTFHGVTVKNGHVSKIILESNNLNGTIPASFTGLLYLEELNCYDNNLSGEIPDIGAIPTLINANFNYNDFSFQDLETNYISNNALTTFNYQYQKKRDTEDSFDGVLGNNYDLVITPDTGTNVQYQWFKKRVNYFDYSDELIAGATSNTYTITGLTEDDIDIYTCRVTSDVIPDLVIERNIIDIKGEVSQLQRDALIAIYNSTNGANWNDNTNWLSAEPISTWYGVTVGGNKIRELVFDGNNLTGTLPPEIGNLTGLEYLSFYTGNSINGTLPPEIGNLTELRVLSFEQNNFTGEIPASYANLTKLRGFWLWDNQLSGNVPAFVATNYPNLVFFDISFNDFDGTLPDFTPLQKIRHININNNHFFPGDFSAQFNDYLNLQDSWSNSGFYTPQYTTDSIDEANGTEGDNITLTLTDNSSSRLSSSSTLASDTYQWFKDDVLIDGATASSYTITNAQVTDSGVYHCEISNTDVPGLVVLRQDITVTVGTLRIDDNELQSISIYPNPVKETFNIILNNYENASATLYDLRGRLILNQKLDSELTAVNISNLNDGIYVLNVENKTGKVTKRIIKK